MQERIIVKAYEGEPLSRVAVGRESRSIYVCNPALLEAVRAGESSPVLFPMRDVFSFDETAYRRLRSEWEANGTTSAASWTELKPIQSKLASRG